MRAVKSVSIDSERRVIITFLDGSTETLYPNSIWCDSEALRQLIKDLLEEKADAIVVTINDVAIATFADGADEALIRKLLVSIEPIQEGTGDPSPENVRPISGRTGLTVYRSGSDTSDPTEFPVTWESEAGTVYGGTLDVITGKLISDMEYNQMTYQYLSQLGAGYIGITENPQSIFGGLKGVWVRNWNYTKMKGRVAGGIKSACNAFPISVNNTNLSSTQNRVYFGVQDTIDSVEAFLSAVQSLEQGGSGLWVAYEVAEPVEYQLTPQEITTLLGDNNIWADSGNILELEYIADTKLYIGESQSGTLGSGRQTITSPVIQPVSEKTLEELSEAYKAETEEKETQEETEVERGE